MCGRYTLFTPAGELEVRFDAAFEEPFEPRYNCVPGQSLPVLTNDDPDTFRRLILITLVSSRRAPSTGVALGGNK